MGLTAGVNSESRANPARRGMAAMAKVTTYLHRLAAIVQSASSSPGPRSRVVVEVGRSASPGTICTGPQARGGCRGYRGRRSGLAELRSCETGTGRPVEWDLCPCSEMRRQKRIACRRAFRRSVLRQWTHWTSLLARHRHDESSCYGMESAEMDPLGALRDDVFAILNTSRIVPLGFKTALGRGAPSRPLVAISVNQRAAVTNAGSWVECGGQSGESHSVKLRTHHLDRNIS